MLIGFALLSAALPIVMFGLMTEATGPGALVGAIILAAMAGGVSAVAAAATAEQFPTIGRLSGLAFGVTTATAIFGGLTPYVAQLLLEKTGWSPVPGLMITVVALAVLPVFLMMPETLPNRQKAVRSS